MSVERSSGDARSDPPGGQRATPSILPQLRGPAWVSAADAEHWTPELMLVVEQATADLWTIVGQVARIRRQGSLGPGPADGGGR